MLNSNSTFDDIKIGDTFISGETGETLRISDKNKENFPTPNITFTNENNTGGATSSYDEFIKLFKNGQFLYHSPGSNYNINI